MTDYTDEDLRLLALLEKAVTVDLTWKAGDATASQCFFGDAVRHALAAFRAEARREVEARLSELQIAYSSVTKEAESAIAEWKVAVQSAREACERIVESEIAQAEREIAREENGHRQPSAFQHGYWRGASDRLHATLRRLRERAK